MNGALGKNLQLGRFCTTTSPSQIGIRQIWYRTRLTSPRHHNLDHARTEMFETLRDVILPTPDLHEWGKAVWKALEGV
jgi:hypothetical protein